ncbi:hypothetical protein ACFFGT_10510 [Mucilaginibacter angelicae]|uniref:Fibronectin type-III domain-containing protein n=1 Tax=Mucilaginibacter angelicae TaxID=869718 RepID=A0ABV6L5C3_9SPHI
MKKLFTIIPALLVCAACGGKKNTPDPGGNAPPPSMAILKFPDKSAVCTNGTIISDTTSSVVFTWNNAANTDSYTLHLKNLFNGINSVQTTSQTQLSILLRRNTPYSWFIVSGSKNSAVTAESEIWKFYNAGKGTVTYAPFPAEISAPGYGQHITVTSGVVKLSWKGSTVLAGTISDYDVYFGSISNPPAFKKGITTNYLENVSVLRGNTYYWKIITRDILGDTSDSGTYIFTVD